MGKDIKIVKNGKAEGGYTFIEDSIDLPSKGDSASDDGKKKGRDFASKSHPENRKVRARSRLTGGHSKQGHSPVYE